jgi:hypothetical protein
MLAEMVAALPPGEPGKSVTADDVRPMLAEMVAALPKAKDGIGLAGAVIDRNGSLIVTLSDGAHQDLGQVQGPPGLGFEDARVEYDGERTIAFVLERGDRREEFKFTMPVVLYRGVWQQRGTESPYQQGDSVTWKGSIWIAQRETTTKPDEINRDWRLAVKHGRDGRDAKPPRGES